MAQKSDVLSRRGAENRRASLDFRVGDLVRFVADLNRHDQVEHPDPMPPIPAGSQGEVVENNGRSVVVRTSYPGEVSRTLVVRLYPRPAADDDCSLELIRPLRYSPRFALQEAGPRVAGFAGPPDEHLEGLSPEELRRIDAAWPDRQYK